MIKVLDKNGKDIAVVTVLKNQYNFDDYKIAQNLFHCYALYHRYRWIVVDVSKNTTMQRLCSQKDVNFKKLNIFSFSLQIWI